MKEVFALFYAVLFGALLSAEIGSKHFQVPDSSAYTWGAWLWRAAWLVGARAGYFAWVYVRVYTQDAESQPVTPWRAAAALLLCAPVLGFQQLSYTLPLSAVWPPGDATAWGISWLVNGILCGLVIPWAVARKVGG